jgi:endonuclease/exonuclease/phosphatase family metal-dependent hydrolase
MVGEESKPGLVLVQIDGLSRPQLEKALQNGKMPFLESLIKKQGYILKSMYSGLPSNTPGFQGEFFYGIKGVVPAFSFKHKKTNELIRMFDPKAVSYIQGLMEKKGPGLLENGSAYLDLFSGGAHESHFCPATLGWNTLRNSHPLMLLIILITHFWSFARVGALLLLESVLSIGDFFRGLIAGQDLWKELKFVPTRVAICILLRELVTIGATFDTVRGLPIIHLNYLGYDEQAHRRGPSSAFAHWTLKGIDDAICRVWKSARNSPRRNYEIWIYSDHGQEWTIPFEVENGKSVQKAVQEVMDSRLDSDEGKTHNEGGIQLKRIEWLGGAWARWFAVKLGQFQEGDADTSLVTAMGPLGHVYPREHIRLGEQHKIAKQLVEEAKIPLVLVAGIEGIAHAWMKEGQFILPQDAKKVLGDDHPFLREVTEDLIRLCHHPDSGEFVISGWRKQGRPISFPSENGGHAGPGNQETFAFALIPPTSPVIQPERVFLRPMDLRKGVIIFLGRSSSEFKFPRQRQKKKPQKLIRLMTYNVHTCRGMDGRLLPDRIAKVIAQYDPDIVALQELDAGRLRTGEIDQAHTIAHALEMDFHFHPAIQLEEEQYGDAILTRFPMKLIRAKGLPGIQGNPLLEPRGALWVSISLDENSSPLQVINTHLGLVRRERLIQTEAILGPDWVGHPACTSPRILCGDFNALPGSPVWRKITENLSDAQTVLEGHQPKKTWFGRYPLGRIDHIFLDSSIMIRSAEVPRTELTRVASDHLPLIVDLELP